MKINNRTSNEFEILAWQNNHLCIGIDEAGRGPIAGPLVVAGVVFEKGFCHDEIYDSKKISEKKRLELFDYIKEVALDFKILIIDESEIDRLNIYRATQKAMEDIARSLQGEVVLSDAMPLTNVNKEIHPIIKGDQKSVSIAAASILAKVTRDKMMQEYDLEFPNYGFAKHKGYPTKAHLEALNNYGITKIHRLSYKPVAILNQMKFDFDE